MYIYHSKLTDGFSFYHAIEGNFSGRNKPEIVVSCNSVLGLYTVESDGRLRRHCMNDIRCKIRSLAVLKRNTKDYVAVASDSGHALIVFYSPERNAFVSLFKQRFASYTIPGCLPEFPGEFVATSWGGVIYAARCENFYIYGFYTLEPMEKKEPIFMHQQRCVIYDIVGIEWPNSEVPMFVSLEVKVKQGAWSYDKHQQFLKIYKIDLENREVCLAEDPLPDHGNKLIAVPKGRNHPYGVIICYENKLAFRPLASDCSAKDVVTFNLPQRTHDTFNSKRGFIINSSAVYEEEGNSVILVQSEQGDLFSVTIEVCEGAASNKKIVMKILYIDTIPVATAMCVRSGYLFIAAEYGDNYTYKIKSLGKESETIEFVQFMPDEDDEKLFQFEARELQNLSICEILPSITPVMHSFITTLKSDLPCNDLKKFIFACGRGPSSTLRIQRCGVQAKNMYETQLPPYSQRVWSATELRGGRVITYVLVSLVNSTMVLSFDENIAIDNDNGFEYGSPTLNCAQCTPDSVIQVYPSGFRHVSGNYYTAFTTNKTKKFTSAEDVLDCALYGRQVALALVNRDGRYIEVEDVVISDGSRRIRFNQMETKFTFKSAVMCMEFILSDQKSKHLAVCLSDSLEIYSVDLKEMKCLFTYQLTRMPESLCVSTNKETNEGFNSIIHIGYNDGTLQRIAANEEGMKSQYSMKLGTRPVKLYTGRINGNFTVLAVSNRPWISFYSHYRLYSFAPLDYDQVDEVAFFSSRCTENMGINLVVLSKLNKCLKFLSVRHWQSLITDAVMKLTYTPNQMVVNPDNNLIIIAETDKRPTWHKLDEMTPQRAMDLAYNQMLPKEPKKKDMLFSNWDSLLHIIDPSKPKTVFKEPIPINEAVVSMRLIRFREGNPLYLLVGIQTGILLEEMNRESQIYIYEVSSDGKSFKLVNKMIVEDLPKTFCPIEGYVLIGIGHALCLYSFLQETKTLQRRDVQESKNVIEAIWTKGIFVIVKTADDKITYGYLDKEETSVVMIHEDRFMRAVTDVCFWDNDVIFVASRDSISAVMLPYYEGCSEQRPKPTDPEIIQIMKKASKLSLSDPVPRTSQTTEAGPSTSSAGLFQPQPVPSSLMAGLFPPQPVPSTSRARPTSPQPVPSTSRARPTPPQPRPSTSREPNFKLKPSTSRAGPSQAEPSTSRAGPSQAEPSTVREEPVIYKISSPSFSSKVSEVYRYPFLRIQESSYTLCIHKVGEYVNSLQKTSLIKDGREVIVYVTASGIIGTLVPFLNETHHKMFGPLEYLSFKANPLLDSEWLEPLNPKGKNIFDKCYDDQYVIVETACEAYASLKWSSCLEIAKKLGLSPQEVLQNIEELKRTIYF